MTAAVLDKLAARQLQKALRTHDESMQEVLCAYAAATRLLAKAMSDLSGEEFGVALARYKTPAAIADHLEQYLCDWFIANAMDGIESADGANVMCRFLDEQCRPSTPNKKGA